MSIDAWTIAFEIVNFLVLIWLLERLLYRPVLAVVARRQEQIERLHEAGAAAHAEVEAQRKQLDEEREVLAAARARALEEAHAQAREEGARLEVEARAATERLLAEGRARLQRERIETAQALRRKSVEMGVAIARKLLRLSASPEGEQGFLDAVCERLNSMSASERERLSATLGERSIVKVVTARPLDSRTQSRFRDRIAKSLGRPIEATFSCDDSLIMGVEIFLPDSVLRHSWRDALAAGQAGLAEQAEQALFDAEGGSDPNPG